MREEEDKRARHYYITAIQDNTISSAAILFRESIPFITRAVIAPKSISTVMSTYMRILLAFVNI